MRLFIVTLSSKAHGEEKEFCQFNRSLAELAVACENMRLRVRAIEEIPASTTPLPYPPLSDGKIGEMETYRAYREAELCIFPEES